jgi:hypothetical protein
MPRSLQIFLGQVERDLAMTRDGRGLPCIGPQKPRPWLCAPGTSGIGATIQSSSRSKTIVSSATPERNGSALSGWRR